MASASGQPSHALAKVNRYALGTEMNARTLRHAQQLGVRAGRLNPWTVTYMRASVTIWLETCPDYYVAQMGRAISTYAAIMRAREVEAGLFNDWALLLLQAEAIVTAVDEQLPNAPRIKTGLPRTGGAPGILRYDKLASLCTKAGVARLEDAGAQVAAYCQRRLYGDVSNHEIEWLRALQNGDRTADLAARVGYSERDFYRALGRLWAKLGVNSRAEGIALASRMGWLDNN
jgi:DNA-binding CsgD family transcriptional regulator